MARISNSGTATSAISNLVYDDAGARVGTLGCEALLTSVAAGVVPKGAPARATRLSPLHAVYSRANRRLAERPAWWRTNRRPGWRNRERLACSVNCPL
jgi:hypothetical protein